VSDGFFLDIILHQQHTLVINGTEMPRSFLVKSNLRTEQPSFKYEEYKRMDDSGNNTIYYFANHKFTNFEIAPFYDFFLSCVFYI